VTTLKNLSYFAGGKLARRTGGDDLLWRAARRDRRLAVTVYLGGLAASIATGLWPWFLLLWVLPLVTIVQLILRLRAVCEHGAVTDLTSPLTAARTTFAPWWVRWLLFPHDVHFHVEHHLYPSVPCYRLADCHRALHDAGLLAGAEQRTLAGALRLVFADPADPVA
jgi:fatty acid desaturase